MRKYFSEDEPELGECKRYITWAKRYYNGLRKSLFEDPHLSRHSLSRIAVKMGVILGILDASGKDPGYEPKQALKWVNKNVGYNMPKADIRKQEFWNEVIRREEVRLLLKEVPYEWYALILTTIMSGLRLGELLAMRWKNLNWNREQYFVKEGLHRGRKQADTWKT